MQQGTGQALAVYSPTVDLLASPSTMFPLPLVVLLTLAAGSDRTVPVGCREDFETCREDCTIDYGGSTTKYRQLRLCLQSCEKAQSECTTRHYSLRDTGDDEPGEDTRPAARPETPRDGVRRGVYRAEESAPAPEAEPAVTKQPEPAPEPKVEPVPEPKAEPAPEPKAEPEPVPEPKAERKPEPEPEVRPAPKQKNAVKKASGKSGDMRIFGDDESGAAAEPAPEPEPAPRPAPKRVEPPPRPAPPPDPKKKDISDWDPNER
ncbi:MAG TPA: hypothetical protein VEU33_18250 [Archangium sp.]|nr:hypothetical protein [Archangium sp.]